MKRNVKPDEVFFVLAATMGVTVISVYAALAVINLVAYLIF
jgi:hypothetical protein